MKVSFQNVPRESFFYEISNHAHNTRAVCIRVVVQSEVCSLDGRDDRSRHQQQGPKESCLHVKEVTEEWQYSNI